MTSSHLDLETGGKPSPDELNALTRVCAKCLRNYGSSYLEIAHTKARSSLFRRITLPYYYLVLSRMKGRASRLDASEVVSRSREARAECLSAALEALPLSERRKRDFFNELFRSIVLEAPNSLVFVEKHLGHLLGKKQFAREHLLLQLLQAQKKIYGALAKGRNILAREDITPNQIIKILREPCMLLGAFDLVPEASRIPQRITRGLICYVAASSLPYSVVGYTTRTEGVALGYGALGFDVRVLTRPPFPLNIKPELAPEEIPEVESFNGVEYHRLLNPLQKGLSPLEYVEQAAAALERKFQELNPEIIIAASNHMNALPSLIAARRLGLPFVYEVRGFWELSRVARDPDYADSAHFLISQHAEAFVASKADKVLTLTSQMQDDLVSRGVQANRIALMPNGVAESLISTPPRDGDLAESLKIPDDVPIIGYVGSILEYEGLQDLGRACGILAQKGIQFRLMLVGAEKPDASGETPILEEIRSAFRENGIMDWLILPGRVPFADVSRYYSLIDIAPIPRRPYAVAELVTPIKPLEAMAMAKAVLVSDVAALKDLVVEGQTGLTFRKGDLADLALKLEQLLVDADLRMKIQKGGQKFVLEQRIWPKICEAAAVHIDLKLPDTVPE